MKLGRDKPDSSFYGSRLTHSNHHDFDKHISFSTPWLQPEGDLEAITDIINSVARNSDTITTHHTGCQQP